MNTPSPPTRLTVLVLVVSMTAAGCIGLGQTDVDDGPTPPFASFDAAMQADGDEFKPLGTATQDTRRMTGEVSDAEYTASHPFPVNTTDANLVSSEIQLSPGVAGAELTFVLRDADGGNVQEATLDSETTQATLETTEVPASGEWTVDVSGQGVQASYTIDITVDYPSTHPLTVKVFEPADREGLSAGEHPVVFLLYDADAQEPVEDADISLESWATSMGHGSDGPEEDPMHLGHGLYEGTMNPSMPAQWVIRLDVTASGHDEVRFEVPYEVTA